MLKSGISYRATHFQTDFNLYATKLAHVLFNHRLKTNILTMDVLIEWHMSDFKLKVEFLSYFKQFNRN